MKYPAQAHKRALSLLLGLVMLLASFTFPALAAENWDQLQIMLNWTDANGQPFSMLAEPVTGNVDQAFWAQVDASAFNGTMTISVSHPEHPEYSFSPAEGEPVNAIDAGASMDGTPVIITAMVNGETVDTYLLYVSSLPMPQETPAEAPTEVPTEVPTDTPAPTEVPDAVVTVEYQTDRGESLGSMTQHCPAGMVTPIYAPSFDGYVADAEQKNVTVDANGTPDQWTITFVYTAITTPEPAPVDAVVTVVRQDRDGNILGQEEKTVPAGQSITVSAPEIEGYTADVQEQTVSADTLGNASPNPVIFTYAKNETPTPVPVPTEVEIAVIYTGNDGAQLFNETCMVQVGQSTTLYAKSFDGYTADETEKTVDVDENGEANPNPVIFTYTKEAVTTEEPVETDAPYVPQEVSVKVLYRAADGSWQQEDTAVCLTGESVPVPAREVEGYIPDQQEILLSVNENGEATPAEIVFTYTANAAETPAGDPTAAPEIRVVIRYEDSSDYHEIAAAQVSNVLAEGPNNISAAPENLEEGYHIVSEPNVTVDVAKGVADPAEVVFYYAKASAPAEPVNATVTVYYHDRDGRNIAEPVVVTIEAGTEKPITPDASHVPEGYTPYQAEPVTVKVDANGISSTDSVEFVYDVAVIETPIPMGETINRFGRTNDKQVKLRSEPSTSGGTKTVLASLNKGTAVWMVKEELNSADESWTSVIYNGQNGYIMSKFLTVMTEAESNQFEQEECSTPVPRDPSAAETPTAAPALTEVNVTAYYRFTDGRAEETENVSCKVNEKSTIPARTYPGYTPDYETITVFVDETGKPDQEVVFTYTAIPVIPDSINVTVLYQDKQGNEIASSTQNCATGKQTTIYASAMDGYTPITTQQVVTVDANGTPDQNPVIFVYSKNAEVTATPAPYAGYALTRSTVALRTEISTKDESIITTLPADTLLLVDAQSIDASGAVWSRGTTLDKQQGFVPDSALRHINNEEADYYIRQWEDIHNTPTPEVTAEPPQQIGYAYTVGDGVYFRSQPDTMSEIFDVIGQKIPLYVMGQFYKDGVAWHIVNYNGRYGYIRADMLRMMSAQETLDYINNLTKGTPTPVPRSTPQPYDETAMSSYGYVSSSSVNFRKTASTSGAKIRTLKKYAFCLILGTEEINGKTWYRISYNGTTGYVMGDYFKRMTMAEVSRFLTSNEYKQGIANNTTTTTDNTGSNVANGGSAEDDTVNRWQNPNSGLTVSYVPFNPFGTVAPLQPTETPTASASAVPTASAMPTASVLPTPEATTTIEPIATKDVTYPTDTENTGSSIGWIIGVLIAMVCVGGGVYGYVVYRQNKRRVAQQRAAAKRAAAQRGAERQPYARTANPQQHQGQSNASVQARRPYAPQQGGQAPYARTAAQPGSTGSTYRRPEVTPAPDATQQQSTQQAAPYAGYRPVQPRQQGTQSPYNGSYRQDDGATPYTASYRQDGDQSIAYTPRRRVQHPNNENGGTTNHDDEA